MAEPESRDTPPSGPSDKTNGAESKASAARWALTLGALVTSTLAIWGAFTTWHQEQVQFRSEATKLASDEHEAAANRQEAAKLSEQQAEFAVKLKRLEIDQKNQEFRDTAVGQLLAHILSGDDATPYLGQLSFYSDDSRYSGPLLDALGSRIVNPKSESEVRLAFLALDRSGTMALDT